MIGRAVGNVVVIHHGAKALNGSLQVRRLDLCDMVAAGGSGVAYKVSGGLSGGPKSVSIMWVAEGSPVPSAHRTWSRRR